MKKVWFVVVAVLCMGFVAQAEPLRFSELTGDVWEKFQKGELQEVIIEFRKGDLVPVKVCAEGDLLGIDDPTTIYVTVKETFFIKFTQTALLMSRDNQDYKPFNELITGSFTAGAASDKNGGPVHSIDMLFRAFFR